MHAIPPPALSPPPHSQPPTPKPLTSLHMAGAHPTLFPSRSTEIHGDPRRSSTDITTETHGNHEACACVAYALRLAHTPPERIRHAQASLSAYATLRQNPSLSVAYALRLRSGAAAARVTRAGADAWGEVRDMARKSVRKEASKQAPTN